MAVTAPPAAPSMTASPSVASPPSRTSASVAVPGLAAASRARERARERTRRNELRLLDGLGWFGVALGAAQLLAPDALARLAGAPGRGDAMRALGLRELATGIGVLRARDPRSWLWGRVAGDATDLALLLMAGSRRGLGPRLGITMALVAGVTALDVMAVRRAADPGLRLAREVRRDRTPTVEHVIAVAVSPDEAYRHWRQLENLPRFMRHLVSVEAGQGARSHWVARGPAGRRVEWEAELTADVPGERLAWQSLEGSEVDHAGDVRFDPATGRRGTLVRARITWAPPGGRAGRTLARLLGESPEVQVPEDLRRFKRVIETGEIPTTEGQSSGTRSTLGGLVERLTERQGGRGLTDAGAR